MIGLRIIYTKHAELKFTVLKKHNFIITKDQIQSAIKNPEAV